MGDRIATVIIEPRSLVREALVSLMENNSYDVVCSVASAADIDVSSAITEPPKLVIFGALLGGSASAMTSTIRRLWQSAKIVVLFEGASSAELQKLMASEIDGCIPIFVSPRTLMRTLELIIAKDLRMLVLGDATLPRPPMPIHHQEQRINIVGPAMDFSATIQPSETLLDRAPSWNELTDSGVRYNSTPTSLQSLSAREEQVLKALIAGHSNKVIARMCSVTEATVKVHMK